jgi:RNA polymerase sigma-70 factor (ECF subfamily)
MDVDEQRCARAGSGDAAAREELFARHRSRLARMVALRMDARLRGRVDVSDVVQDALIEAAERLPKYLGERPMPFFLWLRFLTSQRLAGLARANLGAQARDVRREVLLEAGTQVTGAAMAGELFAQHTSPSQAAGRAELRERVVAALEALDPLDREILALRHFEALSNEEAARELGIEPAAASKRFLRALGRLKPLLDSLA